MTNIYRKLSHLNRLLPGDIVLAGFIIGESVALKGARLKAFTNGKPNFFE